MMLKSARAWCGIRTHEGKPRDLKPRPFDQLGKPCISSYINYIFFWQNYKFSSLYPIILLVCIISVCNEFFIKILNFVIMWKLRIP